MPSYERTIVGLPQDKQLLTVAEYLEIERKAEFKSEFFKGKMTAKHSANDRHCCIVGNVLAEVHCRLKSKPFRVFNSDLRLRTGSGLFAYPDLSAAGKERQFEDNLKDVLLNPVLVIEVLSESTEGYDRGKKFNHYRTIESLREYVLISQSEPMVQTFLRLDDGCWKMQPIQGVEQSVTFESINVTVPMSDIYRDVVFDEPEKLKPSPQ